jgi:hypothetical protein
VHGLADHRQAVHAVVTCHGERTPALCPDWAGDDPLMCSVQPLQARTPGPGAWFNTSCDGLSRHSRTRGRRRSTPETCAAP